MSQAQSTARPKRKPEKIHFRVIKGGLVPADQYAESLLRNKNFKIGDVVGAEIRKLRNVKFNRLVHRIGQLCAANIEEFVGIDPHRVIKRLQIEGRIACDEIGVLVPGFGMVIQFIPRSMSFSEMDEAEYHDSAKKICRLIAERYWKGLEPEQIAEMAESMVEE
ncbi:MAG: hypothetical protein K2Q45_00015 [Nitrosomonas sp.]|nr:hypothetical protein [Nitrosomonas sp.]